MARSFFSNLSKRDVSDYQPVKQIAVSFINTVINLLIDLLHRKLIFRESFLCHSNGFHADVIGCLGNGCLCRRVVLHGEGAREEPEGDA